MNIHTETHTYKYTHHTYISHTHMNLHICTHTRKCMHYATPAHIYMNIHTHIQRNIISAHTYTYHIMRTPTNTYICKSHTYIYMHRGTKNFQF